MPQAVRALVPLDFDAISEASARFQILTDRLPADAVQAFANEVVKRLSTTVRSIELVAAPVCADLIDRLCDALVSPDPQAGALMISQIRADGTSVDDVYLLYLAAAARRLGQRWDSDELTFVQVTIGTNRILAIMRSLASAYRARPRFLDRVAVFAAVPDEHHTIGITMASDMFRRDGWEIDLLVGLEHDEILDRISGSEAPVVGLTAHGSQSLGALLRLIAGIRIVAPSVYILVSGHIVEEAKDIIELTGADGFAADVPTALVEAQRLVDLAHV